MKKVLFLMLLLAVLGAASVSAQVRIGGDEVPNEAAVLDLNATDAINNGTKGLALPRVNFSSNTAQITSGVANLTGMLVYNTNTTLGAGVYFWDGSNWVIISGDGIVGNEVTGATAGGGLVRNGSGTAADPYTLAINTGGVTSAMIMDGTISTSDLSNNAVTLAKLSLTIHDVVFSGLPSAEGSYINLSYPPGCSSDNSILQTRGAGRPNCVNNAAGAISVVRVAPNPDATDGFCKVWCFK